MRKKKTLINIVFSILLEVITVVSGLIIPRLIIGTFGSAANGLISSITNFLGYITLLQSGVGSVIRASLYKPLARKDHDSLCVVLKTAESFFRKIAYLTLAYIAVLSIVYPLCWAEGFDFLYTMSLILIIGMSIAGQYFWGITYQMLLEADQRSYVYSLIQIVTIILNTVTTVLLIRLGASIQFVKLASAVFFVLRPFVINRYAKRRYHVNTNVKPDTKLIAQRWDGFAQAIAYFIHSKTDVFVLTLFSTFENISVYSVYALVTTGLTSFLNCIDKAVKAALGNIIANEEYENLQAKARMYTAVMHMLSTICFGTAAVTVFNFVRVYTKGVLDADYLQPVFGVLIITAEYLYCLRMPYNAIITSAGRFRETKRSAYIEAIINIAVSCALVKPMGLTGIAIGTVAAMAYRTISFVIYLHRDVLRFSFWSQIRRYLVTLGTYALSICLFSMIRVDVSDYAGWALYALVVFCGVAAVTVAGNLLLDGRTIVSLAREFVRPGRRK
ncbi:MAG: lipopolysaccharide biosynthesis protein [Aristaeellaceae bacterium]